MGPKNLKNQLYCDNCKKNTQYILVKTEKICDTCYAVIGEKIGYSEASNTHKNYKSKGQNYMVAPQKNQIHLSTMIDLKSRDSRGQSTLGGKGGLYKSLYASQRKLNVTAGYNRNFDRVSEMLNQYKEPLGLSNLACSNILKLYSDQVSGGFAKGKNANGILLACIYIHAIKKSLPVKIEQLLPYAEIRAKRIFEYIRKLKKIIGLTNFKKNLQAYATKYTKMVIDYYLAQKNSTMGYETYSKITLQTVAMIKKYNLQSSGTNLAAAMVYLILTRHYNITLKQFSKIVKITPITMQKKVEDLLEKVPFEIEQLKSFIYLENKLKNIGKQTKK